MPLRWDSQLPCCCESASILCMIDDDRCLCKPMQPAWHCWHRAPFTRCTHDSARARLKGDEATARKRRTGQGLRRVNCESFLEGHGTLCAQPPCHLQDQYAACSDGKKPLDPFGAKSVANHVRGCKRPRKWGWVPTAVVRAKGLMRIRLSSLLPCPQDFLCRHCFSRLQARTVMARQFEE